MLALITMEHVPHVHAQSAVSSMAYYTCVYTLDTVTVWSERVLD